MAVSCPFLWTLHRAAAGSGGCWDHLGSACGHRVEGEGRKGWRWLDRTGLSEPSLLPEADGCRPPAGPEVHRPDAGAGGRP